MTDKDWKLWRLAKKRAKTKRNGILFLVLILFFWLVWLANNDFNLGKNILHAWPKWPTIGLIVAFVFEYIDAYHRGSDTMTEKEYDKLKKDKNI